MGPQEAIILYNYRVQCKQQIVILTAREKWRHVSSYLASACLLKESQYREVYLILYSHALQRSPKQKCSTLKKDEQTGSEMWLELGFLWGHMGEAKPSETRPESSSQGPHTRFCHINPHKRKTRLTVPHRIATNPRHSSSVPATSVVGDCPCSMSCLTSGKINKQTNK